MPITRSNHWLGSEHPTYLRCVLNSARLQFTAEVSFLSIAAVVLVYTLILVCPHPFLLRSLLTASCSTQRNYIRYKNALPNGDWKLMQVPADIYMVCFKLYSPPTH
jgi:hypothetical protein